jgi:hypothetical protein
MTIQTATKRKHSTLEERIRDAQHRIWQDLQAEPFALLRSWCGSSLELDYTQYGTGEMSRRIVVWMHRHARCGADSCVADKERAS